MLAARNVCVDRQGSARPTSGLATGRRIYRGQYTHLALVPRLLRHAQRPQRLEPRALLAGRVGREERVRGQARKCSLHQLEAELAVPERFVHLYKTNSHNCSTLVSVIYNQEILLYLRSETVS